MNDNLLFWFKLIATFGAGIAMITDIQTGKIYNWLTFPMMMSGWAAHAYLSGTSGLLLSFGATFLGLAIYFPLAAVGLIGMGDVKLLGAIGAWGGGQFVIWVFLIASAIGLPHALLILYLNYGKYAIGMLITSFQTGFFLKKRIFDTPKDEVYKFYLGQDLFLGCLLATFFPLPSITFW